VEALMGAEAIIQIVTSALGIVAQVAPGVLAAITGARTDEDAIAAAKVAVGAIRRSPAASAINTRRNDEDGS
jgi:hypothetical protein